jgi:hypothetical protein
VYPASAVFKAVSARPLQHRGVEIKVLKNRKTFFKVRKIGFSIISPPPAVDFCSHQTTHTS